VRLGPALDLPAPFCLLARITLELLGRRSERFCLALAVLEGATELRVLEVCRLELPTELSDHYIARLLRLTDEGRDVQAVGMVAGNEFPRTAYKPRSRGVEDKAGLDTLIQLTVMPPFTTSVCPVTKPASSLAK
jgi:hypothetical protein